MYLQYMCDIRVIIKEYFLFGSCGWKMVDFLQIFLVLVGLVAFYG